jgi:hypothetical protein
MSQSSLFDFQETKFVQQGLYDELKQCGYVDSHKKNILELLWDMKSHASKSVQLAGGAQYNARILELRRDGWEIITERSGEDPKIFFFRLYSHRRRWLK